MLRGRALVGTPLLLAASLWVSLTSSAWSPPAQAQAPATPRTKTMAVLPLKAEGLQLNEANRLNLLLRARAGTRGGYAVQTEDLTNQLVEASQSLGVNCDINAVGCGVEIGKIADVDYVLLGRAVRVASTDVTPSAFGVETQLVDVKAGQGLRRIFGLVAIDTDQQTNDVDRYANALFGDERLPNLDLTITPDGSTITLDGIIASTSPSSPIEGLLPGPHVVTVTKKGHLPYLLGFTVAPGEAAHLDVVLAVDPDAEKEIISPLQIALPFVGAGVGGVVALTGAGLIIGGLQPWLAHEQANADIAAAEREAEGTDDALFPDRVATLNEKSSDEAANWQSWGLPTTVAGGVAVGVGLAAVAAGVTWGVVLLNSDAELADDAAAAAAR